MLRCAVLAVHAVPPTQCAFRGARHLTTPRLCIHIHSGLALPGSCTMQSSSLCWHVYSLVSFRGCRITYSRAHMPPLAAASLQHIAHSHPSPPTRVHVHPQYTPPTHLPYPPPPRQGNWLTQAVARTLRGVVTGYLRLPVWAQKVLHWPTEKFSGRLLLSVCSPPTPCLFAVQPAEAHAAACGPLSPGISATCP